jgi:hypothetical protein
MPLFRKNKDVGVRSFIIKLINNNCPELKGLMEGPRTESRVDMVVVVTIIPMENKRLQLRRAFSAVTKGFSNTGVGVVLDRPRRVPEAILGFRFEGGTTFVRAQGKHLSPMGGGFFQLGLRLMEIVSVGDYPELASASYA